MSLIHPHQQVIREFQDLMCVQCLNLCFSIFSGCYPKCPSDQPYFDEDTMTCVLKEGCGCYDKEGRHYNNGDKVPTTENCQTW